MSKTLSWVLGVIALIIVLVLLYFALPINGTGSSKDGLKKTESNEVSLAKKDCEIRDLYVTVAAKDSSLAQSGRTIALLIKTCLGKSSASGYSRPSNRSYVPAPKTSGSGNSGNYPANTGGGLKSSQTTQPKTETEYKTVIDNEKAAQVTIPEKSVLFCMQVGDHTWFPYIAMLNKENFTNAYLNSSNDGYNLRFVPSGTIGSTGEVCGIAEDLTHWCKVNELAQYLQWDIPKFLIGYTFTLASKTTVDGVEYWAMK